MQAVIGYVQAVIGYRLSGSTSQQLCANGEVQCNSMSELIFVVEEDPEGGYIARALGEAIFTESDDLDGLHEQIRDAVRCHFDEGSEPKVLERLPLPGPLGRRGSPQDDDGR
jgi:hypothetical protein